VRTLGGLTKHGSQTGARDYIAAAAALDGSLRVAYVPPDGPGIFAVTWARCGCRRGPADANDGGWRAIAEAPPNGGPHAFRLPGRNAVKDHDWVLMPDAAPTMSWPQR
jgi:hypothetical protein